METIFGEVKETNYQAETDGIMSSFGKGRVFRHPGRPAMADLSGNHYEMGLQYGVLLKPEIMKGMEAFTPMFRLSAAKIGIPAEYLMGGMIEQSKEIAKSIPARFIEEIRGICDGSGVNFDVALAMALSYDISMASGCTGVIMKDSKGRIIHGRHDDSALSFGNAATEMMVIVRYRPDGFHAVTQPGPILFPGVETGMNDVGIAFSEETLHPVNVNPSGESLPYFVRNVLEEASTLDEVLKFAEPYQFIAGYGMVWSSRMENSAMLLEVAGNKKVTMPYDGPISWNFNQYYSEELIPEEQAMKRAVGYAKDREELAGQFQKKDTYDLSDALLFLRTQINKNGENYDWCGSRTAICNSHSQQTTIFDTNGDGFYFAYDNHHSGLAEMYHYHKDFSITPDLWAEQGTLDAVIQKDAVIENMPVMDEEKLMFRRRLADEYPKDANMQFMVASTAFLVGDGKCMAEHAKTAYLLCPKVVEYGLWAALSFVVEGNLGEADQIISNVETQSLTPYQKIVRLWILNCIKPELGSLGNLEEALKQYGLEEDAKKIIFPSLQRLF